MNKLLMLLAAAMATSAHAAEGQAEGPPLLVFVASFAMVAVVLVVLWGLPRWFRDVRRPARMVKQKLPEAPVFGAPRPQLHPHATATPGQSRESAVLQEQLVRFFEEVQRFAASGNTRELRERVDALLLDTLSTNAERAQSMRVEGMRADVRYASAAGTELHVRYTGLLVPMAGGVPQPIEETWKLHRKPGSDQFMLFEVEDDASSIERW